MDLVGGCAYVIISEVFHWSWSKNTHFHLWFKIMCPLITWKGKDKRQQHQAAIFFPILLLFTFAIFYKFFPLIISGTSKTQGAIQCHFSSSSWLTNIPTMLTLLVWLQPTKAAWLNFQLRDTHIFPPFYSGQDGQHWNLRPMAFLQTKTTDFIWFTFLQTNQKLQLS